mmetsp:Transcript_20669/g.47430  ORF Transcript_20669/g.47430 Transcript_20669/m.47430 type:complete len:228 (-) Transcript_20669:602-1285(-)
MPATLRANRVGLHMALRPLADLALVLGRECSKFFVKHRLGLRHVLILLGRCERGTVVYLPVLASMRRSRPAVACAHSEARAHSSVLCLVTSRCSLSRSSSAASCILWQHCLDTMHRVLDWLRQWHLGPSGTQAGILGWRQRNSRFLVWQQAWYEVRTKSWTLQVPQHTASRFTPRYLWTAACSAAKQVGNSEDGQLHIRAIAIFCLWSGCLVWHLPPLHFQISNIAS